MIYWVVFLFLTACNLAPKYSRPEIDMPLSWRIESDEGSTLANVDWWTSLEDPVLNSLILTALENNKDLQIAIWRVKEFYGQYQVARSPLFPQIELGASALRERIPTNVSELSIGSDSGQFPLSFNPINSEYALNFSLSYEIDFWGEVRNASYAAYSQYLAQIENRRVVILTLVGAVAQGYVFLRQLDLQYQISQKTLESRRESLDIARDRFEGGVTSEIEVSQAESVFEQALAQTKIYERQIAEQENLICLLLGQSPAPITRGKSIDQLFLPKEIPAGLPSDLLVRRPDILRAELNLIAANATIGVARAAFFPQVSLTSLYGWESLELKELFSKGARTWQLGANLLQQIFTGWKLTGELNIAKAQKEELVYQYEQTILNALREVDSALIAHKKSKEIAIIDQAGVDALKEYLYLAWLQYYEGETQYLTVLDAERRLFAAELDLAQAQSDQFLTLVELYKALGGGWVIEADRNLSK
jgi:outer membrane protein, multidrug efflux system